MAGFEDLVVPLFCWLVGFEIDYITIYQFGSFAHFQIDSSSSTMSSRVYVGGLSHRARERDVEKFFRKYGRIREISMKNGYGFVDFEDYRDAEDAVYGQNGRDLMGER